MEALRQYLVENPEITQNELATRVGVKQPTVWEWINGKSKPSAERLKELSKVTGLSIDKLLS